MSPYDTLSPWGLLLIGSADNFKNGWGTRIMSRYALHPSGQQSPFAMGLSVQAR